MNKRSRLPPLSSLYKIEAEIIEIRTGEAMCQVAMKSGDNTIVSVISLDDAEEMNLKVGDKVTAMIKATDVMIMK